MTVLKIGEKEYKIKYGYNSFCDTDLMDRVNDLAKLFSDNAAENDADAAGLGKVRELFTCVRDLLFAGFRKYNPVKDVQEVGDLLDQYKDEAPEGEERGLMQLFTLCSNELMAEGFLSDIVGKAPAPQDKKAQK